jgi:hypothetical protein
MKKFLFFLFVIICFSSFNSFSQSSIFIVHYNNDSLCNPNDTLSYSYRQLSCSLAVPIQLNNLSGITSGFAVNDTVIVRFYHGDGNYTDFIALIQSNQFFYINIPIQVQHTYSSPGLYQQSITAIAPDHSKDSLYVGCTLVSSACDTIKGVFYNDLNLNCVNDNEPLSTNFHYVYLNYNGKHFENYSTISGKYSIPVPIGFNYNIRVKDSNDKPYCNTSYNITSLPVINKDFGLSSFSGYDLTSRISGTGFLLTANHSDINLVLRNLGNGAAANVKNKLIYDHNKVTISSLAPPAPLSGDTIIWSYGIVNGSSYNAATATFHINPTVPYGDIICFTSIQTPVTADQNPDNNVQHICFKLTPYCNDYNFKSVIPRGDGIQGYINNNIDMIYTIDFQNNENATVSNMYIIDTIDTNLDLSTLSILFNSQTMQWSQIAPRVIKFNFPGINLPFAACYPISSMGKVVYKIHQNPNLPMGTIIKNRAYIYYDTYPVIQTNLVLNTINTLTSINNSDEEFGNTFLYPNPTTGKVYTHISEEFGSILKVEVYNYLGEIIDVPVGNNYDIDLSNLENGIYFIVVSNNTKNVVSKVIKTE